MLERILSLIPTDKNGQFIHGEKAKFAKQIGYSDGAIVSMWENGTSQSYKKKLHQIADEYHVSVAWLKGETADPTVEAERAKEKAPNFNVEGWTDLQKAAIQFVLSLPPEKLEVFLKMGRAAFEEKAHE
jgi:hypothetical protein